MSIAEELDPRGANQFWVLDCLLLLASEVPPSLTFLWLVVPYIQDERMQICNLWISPSSRGHRILQPFYFCKCWERRNVGCLAAKEVWGSRWALEQSGEPGLKAEWYFPSGLSQLLLGSELGTDSGGSWSIMWQTRMRPPTRCSLCFFS